MNPAPSTVVRVSIALVVSLFLSLTTVAATSDVASAVSPPTVTLVLDPALIAESGIGSVSTATATNVATVTATLSGASSAATTVTVSAAAVSPAVPGDFRLSSNKVLTIAPGATTSTGLVTITAVDNAVDAPDRRITVSGAASGGNGVADPSDATLTIADDEWAPMVTLALSPSSIAESGSGNVATVTATLSGLSSVATTVTVSAAAVSPAVSGDFTLSSNKVLTIAAGATTSTGVVTITAVDNAVDAPAKTVTVSATASGGKGLMGPFDATLTIADDEGAPTVTLALDPSSIAESGRGNVATVTARLSVASSAATTVTVSAAAVRPAVSGDFRLSSNKVLTIAAGATTSTGLVTITAVDNDVDGPHRRVTVSGAASGGNGVADPSDATLTIADDEGTSWVMLVFDPPSISESGSGNIATVTARLNIASSAVTTVTVNPAVSGDFTLSSNKMLTIAAGATTSTGVVTITAVDNDVGAPDKKVPVSAAVANQYGTGNPGVWATLIITDDDAKPTVTLALGPSSIAESGRGNVATVTARLSVASSAATTVTVSAAAVRPAVSGDFRLSSNKVLRIASGATTSTGLVTITAVDNAVDAPDKRVTVSGAANGGNGVADPSDATLTLTDDDTAGVTVTETGVGTSTTEAAGAGRTDSFTVVLTSEPTADVRIAVSSSDTGEGTVSPASLTFTSKNWRTPQTVTVTGVDDNVDDGDQAYTVVLAAAASRDAHYNGHDPDDVSATNADDESLPVVTLVLDPFSIAESGSGNVATVTARLSGLSSAATTVTVSAAAVSPAVSGDFRLSSNPVLTIAAGATTSTGVVTITAVDNAVDAPNKKVTVSGAASGGNGVADPSALTLTIADDEGAPVVTLVLDPSSIAESGSGNVATVTARLSGLSSAATTVTVSAAAVSPAVSGDFRLSSNPVLTIAAGATTSTGVVTITAVDNAVDAPNKTVTVSGAASGGNGAADPSALTLTITDDESLPVVTLVLDPSSIAESGSGNVATVTARLSGLSSAATTVTVSAAAVSPAVSGDFRLSSNPVLTIAAGATTSTGVVTITAVDNAVDAPDKTVTVSGAASGGNGVADPSALTLTITDDEGAPVVTLVLDPSSIAESGSGNVATVTARLSGLSSAATTVTVSAAAVSPAVSGDFDLSSNKMLTIAAGATTSTGVVTITAVDNAVDAPDKKVTVSGAASGGNGVADPSALTLTIADDEGAPVVTLVLDPSSIAESGSGNVATVTARLSGLSSAATTVTVSAAAVSPAVSGDFDLSSNKMLTIAAGATTSTGVVTITAVDNAVDAPDKKVTVSGAASGGNGVADPSALTLTIADDEGAPVVTLVLDPSSIAESGSGNVATVTARLSGLSSAATTVTVSAAAVSPAVSGDFDLSSNKMLTIAAGATTSTGVVTITAVDNAVDAPDKKVTVSGAASGGNGVADPSALTLTIADDEGAPVVTLVLDPSSIAESGSGNVATVTARLSGLSSAATTVTVSAAAVSPAVSGDFRLSSNPVLTIAAGATTSTGVVTITAVDNAVDAPDKTVTVSGAASGGNGVADPSALTLTITDDEGAPVVTLVLDPSSIAESGSGNVATVTARLSGLSSAATTVTVSAAAVSPAVSGDFRLSSNKMLTIAAGATTSTGVVTITAVDNAVDAPDKKVTVSGAASGGNGVADPSALTLTIADDEGAPVVTLVLDPSSIAESGSGNVATVTARLSGLSSAATEVTVSAVAVSPAVPGDFDLSSNKMLTIAAGATTSTGVVTITAVDNAVDAPDKKVTVSGAASGGNGVADPSALTLTIADDEGAPVVTLVLDPSSITESGSGNIATVTATLSGLSSAATEVTVSAVAVSPAVPGDFDLSSNKMLTIAAGATTSTGVVTITAVDNAVDAPDKTVTVSGAASGGNGAADPSALTLTIADDEGAPVVTLVLDPSSITESGSGNIATVTARLSGLSSAATEVTVSAVAVSPAVPGDFDLSSNKMLTIAAGATTSTGVVTITAVDNAVDAPDKKVTVSGAASGGNGVADPSALTLTIADDEGAPVVTLVLDPSSIAESGSGNVATVTARLSGLSSAATTVTVSAAAVSPAVSGDFRLSSNPVLTIAAGATTSTGVVTITAVDNAVDAPDKTVTVSGAASGGNGVADPSALTLTITDDEGAPVVTLVLDPSSIAESGSGNVATVTARLSGLSSAATTVTVSAAAVSPAVSGDFRLSSNKMLTIAAGATTSTGVVTITAVDNAVDAPDKKVTVSGAASGGNGVADPSALTLTIADDEGAPVVTLVLDPSSIAESGSGNVATVTARLSGLSSAATTVTVSAAAVSPAVSGDFRLSSNPVLTIAAGATTSTGVVTITAVDNAVDAPDKTVTVSGAASGGNGVADPSALTLTITDDEGAPVVTLVLDPSSIAESGSGNVATVTARLSGLSSAATTVTVSAAAVSPAVSGDFRLSSNKMLTIAAGATTSTGVVTITAVDNAVDAPDKKVTVSGAASGGNGVADPSALTLTIADDEGAPVVTLVLDPSSIAESGSGNVATVTARLSGLSSAATTVTVSAAAVSPAVSGDFRLSSNPVLTIAAGATTSTGVVTITAVDNAVDAPDKTVTVSGAASGGNGVADPSALTLTITDDEGAPVVTLVLDPSSIAESGSGNVATVTARLSGLSSAATTVTVSAAAVSPAVSGDFRLSSNPVLTIAAGATTSTGVVTITAVDNAVDAPNKKVTVSGAASGGNGVADPSALTLTITDDDSAGVTVSPTAVTVEENGGTDSFTVVLTSEPTANVTIAVSSSDTDAATVSPMSLTFTSSNWSSPRAVTVTGVNDPLGNADRSATITHVVSDSGGYGGVKAANMAVTVMHVNEPPVAHAGEDWTVAQNATIMLDGGESSDPEGGELNYSWRLVSGGATPKVVLRDADTASPTFVAPGGLTEDAILTFGLTVTDELGLSSPEGRVAMTVSAAVSVVDGKVAFAPPAPGRFVVHLRTALDAAVLPEASEAPAGMEFALPLDPIGEGGIARVSFDLAPADPPPPPGRRSGSAAVVDIALNDGRLTSLPGGGGATLCVPANAPEREEMAVYRYEAGAPDGSRWLPLPTPRAETRADIAVVCAETRTLGLFALFYPIVSDADRARIAEHWLARFGRTVASQAVDMIGARLDGSLPPTGRSRMTVGGQTVEFGVPVSASGATIDADGGGADRDAFVFPSAGIDGDPVFHRREETRSLSTREFLLGSAFQLSTAADDMAAGPDGVWTLWGRTAASGFESVPKGALSLKGDVVSGWIGLDHAGERSMAGLAVSYVDGRGDFDLGIEDGRGEVASSLTSLYPYLRWSPREDLELWGLLGLGRGDLRIEDARGRVETAIGMRMAAAGAQAGVASAHGVDLSLKADALAVRMDSEGVVGLPAVDAEAQRVRLMLEGRSDWALSDDEWLRPSLELGARLDAGDAETGPGLELGGGLAYENTRLGLSVEARGRWLAKHREEGFEEWGASLDARLDPGAPGLGPSFSLMPVWGRASSGIDALWEDEANSSPGGVGTKDAASTTPDRLDVEIGYGLRALGGYGAVTPYGELGLEDGRVRRVQEGLRLKALDLADGLGLEFYAEQVLRNGAGLEHRVGLAGSLRF